MSLLLRNVLTLLVEKYCGPHNEHTHIGNGTDIGIAVFFKDLTLTETPNLTLTLKTICLSF